MARSQLLEISSHRAGARRAPRFPEPDSNHHLWRNGRLWWVAFTVHLLRPGDTIQVKTKLNVSQPQAPLLGNAAGQTVVTPEVETEVKEEETRLLLLEQSVTLSDVVRGLNSVGITPRDIVAILQALKSAGALQADLEVI